MTKKHFKKKWWNFEDDDSPENYGAIPLIEVGKLSLFEPVIINNVVYSVHVIRYDDKNQQKALWAIVEKLTDQDVFINNKEPKEINYASEITCPYCGYKEGNSWEMGEEDDEYECSNCHSTYSYERIVTVEYSSQPVKKVECRKLD